MTQVYYGTKKVEAWPQAGTDGRDGYGVRYLETPDLYISWSPKEVFEEAYQPLDALSFGHALIALQDGKKVARSGWNGKDQFVYYVPPNTYKAQTDAARSVFGEEVPYRAYLALKTTSNDVVPWLASQTDVLANDWVILGD